MQRAIVHYRERFFRILDVASGGVDRALRQLEDWLRPRPGGRGGAGGDDDGDEGLSADP
jgi:hypothetical protein